MHLGWISRRLQMAMVVVMTVGTACTTADSRPRTSAPAPEGGSQAPRAPRGSITIAWAREPENLSPKFLGGAGGSEPSWVFSSALTYYDLQGTPHPMMA